MEEFQAQHNKRFRNIATLTIVAVYFLILVGGIVRASGAGMGCPDWPTCFGQWVPPTHEAQLPADYQQIYAERGYADTRFNPVKTWTEYINRLAGVSIGFLILLTLYYSIPFLKKDKGVFYIALSTFLLVGFQGWLGSVVVASNLKPAIITVHMIVALIIVSMLIYAITRSQHETLANINTSTLPALFQNVLTATLIMTLLQVIMGTQVREAVDSISRSFNHADRHLWREEFPIIFYVHRSFSAAVLFTNAWLAWSIFTTSRHVPMMLSLAVSLMLLILMAIVTGSIMDRLDIPAFIQPVHLLLANLIFGVQSFVWIICRYSND